MAKKRKQSREEWEQELWEKQRNLTFDQSRRAFSHVDASNLPTLTTGELVRLVIGAVLIVLAIPASNYNAVLAMAALVAGLYLIARAMMMGRRRKAK